MTPNIVKGSNSLPKDRYDDPNHPSNLDKYKPDSLKNNTSSDTPNLNTMDGDHSAKTMDSGANAATNATDMADGIHEDANQKPGQGVKETGQGTSVFSKDGAIGSQFKGDGNIGSIGNKIGGPFSSEGAIGKQFEASGGIGGAFQELAKKNEEH